MADSREPEPVDSSENEDAQSPAENRPADDIQEPDGLKTDVSADAGENPEIPVADDGTVDSDTPASPESDESEDDLPDWEPLTPEIVEDEAIRGDFMLRWAVVLLAFLLGCREISETVTLVRVRTGEYLAANGILPPSTDVFSYTATEHPWVNSAWLFDLVVAGLYGAGGATALTLFTALVAGITFYFVHGISRNETPTWWTSVCVAVALMMVNLQFTALPQLITLLGTAWMLRGLHRWSQSGKAAELWCLVVSLAVWSNLDPRAFIGWLVLVAYLAGTALARKSGRGSHHSDASIKYLAIAIGVGLVALMVNPFGWHSIISPFQLYGVEVPALAEYAGKLSYPHEIQLTGLLDAAVWNNLNLHTVSALLIAAVAVITSIMNVSRVDVGLVVAFVATLILAVVCSHELGAMALVACVLASLNGQDWYRANCRQEYSVATFEVLWSRAGRALTVIGFAAIAFLAISGRLMGPNGRRVGLGFSPTFAATIEATKSELEELPDGHIFTFRLDQSDLLLWHGVPTFADSRVGIFVGGETDILRIHNQARHALRRGAARPEGPGAPSQDSSDDWLGRRELWETPFDQFQVNLVTPRMWGASPDYSSYFDLVASPDWNLIEPGATTAFFVRAGRPADAPPSIPDQGLFRRLAFEECRSNPDVPLRVEWPRPPSAYQQFLSLPEPSSSTFSQKAQHELTHLTASLNNVVPMERSDALGLAVLTLRDAVAGASQEPNKSRAFRIQADTYRILHQVEANEMAQYQLVVPTQQRYYQRLFAMRQALVIDPQQLELLSSLAELYFAAGRTDLAFEMIEQSLAVIRELPDSSFNDQTLELARRLNQVKQQIGPQLETVKGRIDDAMQEPEFDRVQFAAALHQAGYPGNALKILEGDRLLIAENPSSQVELALLLAEVGRLDESASILESLEQMGNEIEVPLPVILQLCWLDFAMGDYQRATARCSRRLDRLQSASTQAMLSTLPFSMPTPQFLGEANIWPATQTLISSRTLTETAAEISLLQWTIATGHIEAGNCSEAVTVLKELIAGFPESQFRPMVRIWLQAMTGEEIPDQPPELEPGIQFHDDSDLVDRNAAAQAAEKELETTEGTADGSADENAAQPGPSPE